MKLGITILLILIAVVVVGGIVYFALPQDKCKDVTCNDNNSCTIDSCNSETGNCIYTSKTCLSGQQCNIQTGVCETQANVLDDIENAIIKELNESGTYTSTDGMDRIENAIEEALGWFCH